jgi:hypothetical protein
MNIVLSQRDTRQESDNIALKICAGFFNKDKPLVKNNILNTKTIFTYHQTLSKFISLAETHNCFLRKLLINVAK